MRPFKAQLNFVKWFLCQSVKKLVPLFVAFLLVTPQSFAMSFGQQLPIPANGKPYLNFDHDERAFLRLFSGDTIRLQSGEHVSVVGIDAPEFFERVDEDRYEKLKTTARKWVVEVLNEPNGRPPAEGIGTKQIRTRDDIGKNMIFFYLYMPGTLMEDIRRQELLKYYDEDRAKKLRKDLEARDKYPQTTADEYQKPEGEDFKESLSRKRLVIRKTDATDVSAAKYYYGDGSIKREEVYYDGTLVIKNVYDERGKLIHQWRHSNLVNSA